MNFRNRMESKKFTLIPLEKRSYEQDVSRHTKQVFQHLTKIGLINQYENIDQEHSEGPKVG